MQNLKKVRQSFRLTQQDVAKSLNITQQAYANYEAGKRQPNNETLLRLSEFFGVSIDYLLGADPVDDKHYPAPSDHMSREEELSKLFDDLTDENKEKLLELARLYNASQKEK